MTVYRPKRSPHYHYDFQYRGQRYCASTGCSSKREAEAVERRARHEAANPSETRPPITVDEACGLYAETAERQSSWPTTRYILAAMVKGLGRASVLSGVTQRDMQVYVAKRRNGRANSSVNREIDVMRAVWRKAKAARYEIGTEPDWKDLRLKTPRQIPRELGEGEQDAVFDAIADDARDVVMFALVSGWRRGEVIGLRWSDCHLQRGEARTRIKGGDTVMRPLNAALVALIANQPKVGPFVFTYVCRKSRAQRRAGQRYPMTATALRVRWDEARRAAELSGFRFHDLRHTAATRILRATQNLAATGKVLQHSNLSTTMRYAHVLEDDVRNALDAGQSRNSPERDVSDRKKG